MRLADALQQLCPTETAPTVGDLGGEPELLDEVTDLDSALLPRLIEVLQHEDWEQDPAPVALAARALERLPDLESPIEAANCMDVFLTIAVIRRERDLTRAVMTQLLGLLESHREGGALALRAGYAVRAAADLALLDIGVSAHRLLAVIEDLGEIRAEMAPGLARAAGRLWEHHDSALLRQVLESTVMAHEHAASDALLELGLGSLREAFCGTEEAEIAAALERATDLFDRARAQDEDRPDARAFAAASRAVVSFGRDAGAMSDALNELAQARGELDRYSTTLDGFQGASPLRSVAAWHVLASTLRALQGHIDSPDAFNLRPAIEALTDAYAGMRLGVVAGERRGLQAFIAPIVVQRIGDSGVLVAGTERLAAEPDASDEARALAAEVVRPKMTRLPFRRPIWRRRRPG